MRRLYIFVISLIIIIIVASNFVTFPLDAGSRLPGVYAMLNLENRLQHSPEKIDKNLVAAIVEPRKDNLVETIDHYLKKLPTAFFQVYHGTKNIDILQKYINNPRIELLNMGVDNLTIQGYSRLLCSKAFWKTIRAENCLIFQTDSITCGASNYDLDQFMNYDFVGAPHPIYVTTGLKILFTCRMMKPEEKYYNGGLSFRKRSKMLEIVKKFPWDGKITEDIWFCHHLPKIGGKLPNLDIARKFSFEAEYLGKTPWGLHKPRKNYNKLCKVCPEFKNIPFVNAHTDYRNLYML
jgi:hypothetical protein